MLKQAIGLAALLAIAPAGAFDLYGVKTGMTEEQVKSAIFFQYTSVKQIQLTPEWATVDYIGENSDLSVDFCNGVAESVSQGKEPTLGGLNEAMRMLTETYGQPMGARFDTPDKSLAKTGIYWRAPHDDVALVVLTGGKSGSISAINLNYTAKGRAQCIDKLRK